VSLHDAAVGIAQALGMGGGAQIDWKQVLLIGMTPIFVLALLAEWFYMTRVRQRPDAFYWKDTLTNIGLGTAYNMMEAVTWVVLTAGVMAFVYKHRLFTVPVNGWTFIPIFIGVEFCYYWFHRSSHRIRWFWTAHVAHHAGEHMNMSMAARQSVLNAFIGTWVFYVPIVWLGVAPAVVFFMLALNLTYQFFIHTGAIPKLPRWLEYLFDTPSNHRVHHGKNPQYIDRNYGGVLMIFDHLFGTYIPETEQPLYGLPKPVRSYNFLVLNFGELLAMLRDVRRPGPLQVRLRHVWGPPEWTRPDNEYKN
jgi:sterol desaturase/sphingolipid hydroxylase (fatty acid hydroxylase superfamily)